MIVMRNTGLPLAVFDTVIYSDFLENKTGIFVAIINAVGVLTAQLQMLDHKYKCNNKYLFACCWMCRIRNCQLQCCSILMFGNTILLKMSMYLNILQVDSLNCTCSSLQYVCLMSQSLHNSWQQGV